MVALCETPRPTSSTPAPETPLMLTAADVATLLACSTKTVYRLNDRGGMPRPVRLSGMLRWHRAAIEQWITEGCPPRRLRPRPRYGRN